MFLLKRMPLNVPFPLYYGDFSLTMGQNTQAWKELVHSREALLGLLVTDLLKVQEIEFQELLA